MIAKNPSSATELVDYLHDVYLTDRINLRQSTVQQIEVSIKIFGRFLERPATIDDLRKDTIVKFMAWYAGLVKGSTVNAKRKDLVAIWRVAWDKGDTRCAVRKIPRAREEKLEPEAYFLDTMQAIIKRAGELDGTVGTSGKHRWSIPRSLWWTALLTTQYSTAARIGALRQAKTADCDLARRTLTLRAKTQKQNAEQSFTLIPDAVRAIEAIYDPTREDLFWWPYCRRYFHDYYDRHIIKPLGIPSTGRSMDKTHKIRRTTLSYVAVQNRHQAYNLAGHRNPETTDRHYLDPRIVNPDGASLLVPSLSADPTDDPSSDPDEPAIFSMADYVG